MHNWHISSALAKDIPVTNTCIHRWKKKEKDISSIANLKSLVQDCGISSALAMENPQSCP